MTQSERIIAFIAAHGPSHMRQICGALRIEYTAAGPLITALKRSGELVIVCTASEAGYTDIKAHAPMYGLPGQKLVGVRKPRQKTHSGSGQFAGPITIPQYRWGVR